MTTDRPITKVNVGPTEKSVEPVAPRWPLIVSMTDESADFRAICGEVTGAGLPQDLYERLVEHTGPAERAILARLGNRRMHMALVNPLSPTVQARFRRHFQLRQAQPAKLAALLQTPAARAVLRQLSPPIFGPAQITTVQRHMQSRQSLRAAWPKIGRQVEAEVQALLQIARQLNSIYLGKQGDVFAYLWPTFCVVAPALCAAQRHALWLAVQHSMQQSEHLNLKVTQASARHELEAMSLGLLPSLSLHFYPYPLDYPSLNQTSLPWAQLFAGLQGGQLNLKSLTLDWGVFAATLEQQDLAALINWLPHCPQLEHLDLTSELPDLILPPSPMHLMVHSDTSYCLPRLRSLALQGCLAETMMDSEAALAHATGKFFPSLRKLNIRQQLVMQNVETVVSFWRQMSSWVGQLSQITIDRDDLHADPTCLQAVLAACADIEQVVIRYVGHLGDDLVPTLRRSRPAPLVTIAHHDSSEERVTTM